MNYLIPISFFFILIIIVIKKISNKTLIGLPFWVFTAYTFLLLSHIFSPFVFQSVNYLDIIPYLFINLSLMILGYYIGISYKVPIVKSLLSVDFNKLVELSVVGATAMIFDFFRLNTITLGLRIEDQKLSIIGVIGVFLSSFGIIIWLFYLYKYMVFGGNLSYKAYVGLISYLSFSILSGGRQLILIAFLSSLILIIWAIKFNKYYGRNGIKRNHPIFLYVLVILVIGYLGIVSKTRSQIFNIDDKVKMFENESGAKVTNEFQQFLHIFPFPDMLLEWAFYYSHELVRLEIFFNNYNELPTLGAIQFPYFSRRVQWLTGDILEYTAKNERIAIEQHGLSSHTWGTFLTNYIMDFGKCGALLACLISGIIIGITAQRAIKNPAYYNIARQSLICSGIIFSIQYSPFSEMSWFLPILILSFVNINWDGK